MPPVARGEGRTRVRPGTSESELVTNSQRSSFPHSSMWQQISRALPVLLNIFILPFSLVIANFFVEQRSEFQTLQKQKGFK